MKATTSSEISPQENEVYKRKYSILKKQVKKYVYENAALCDQVFQLQEKIICLKEERSFLLKKTYSYDAGNRQSQDSIEPMPSIAQKGQIKKRDIGPDKNKTKKLLPTSIKRKLITPLPVDSSGFPVFPINLGSLSIYSLGELITDRPSFHSEDLIYPVGFCSTRVYGSLSDPSTPCIYTCTILDGGMGPLFEIASDVKQEATISGDDINAVHTELVRRMNGALGVEVVGTRGRGALFFGISHPSVINLLQNSPGIKRLTNYRMTKFEISKSAEAIVEENDASLTFESLQRSINFTRSQMEDIRQQETLDSTATLRDLLNA